MINLLLSPGDPITKLSVLLGFTIALVVGIAFHEFMHAFTAFRLGDRTPLYQGRLTLNPLAHLDPIGSLMIVVAGFGWGRPVGFNPYALRMNPRVGTGLVSIAGPAANLVLGIVFGLALRFLLPVLTLVGGNPIFDQLLPETLYYFVFINFILAIFNLIPIPPLDGSKILPALLPPDMASSLERFYAQIGPYSLLLLFALFWFAGSVINPIVYGPVFALIRLVVGTSL